MFQASGPIRGAGALRRSVPLLLAALTAVATLTPAGAAERATAAPAAKPEATLRVMLHPAAAPRGTLPDAARARLEALAGMPLALSSTTRTGALEFTVAAEQAGALQAVVQRLRTERSVLWAELSTRTSQMKSTRALQADATPTQRLLVRLAGGADVHAAAQRLSALAGTPVTVERQLGSVHVMALGQSRPASAVDDLARAFEADPAVLYADAVRRVRPFAGVPGDPLFAQQWSLSSIRAADAWQLGTGAASTTVAVVDTGILPHPDLTGRLLPGYDFIADAERARDGDGRDGNARDEGDWTSDTDCGGGYALPSFFHGLFVAGLIGANANNDEGIAGVDWSAKLLPVRVLGKCGGTFEDVLAGMLWSTGVAIEGAPVNAHPAKVVNLSLGGNGACAAAIQEAVDEALAQGTVIVAAAGNESDDAANFAPGNCGGVINVSALARSGDRASYSNWGPRVDVAAPGGDRDDGMLSTHNDGTTVPGESNYALAMGTSFAAPLVSGTVSLMLARNPNLTPGRVLSILQGTTADFAQGSICRSGFCGSGMLDAAAAVQSTAPAVVDLPPGAVAIVEFYDPALDHYFISADPAEIAALDEGGYWQRTGHVFYGWSDPVGAPDVAAPRSVCRFYAGPEVQIDSHYFTADAARCAFVAANGPPWMLQSEAAFWIDVPDASGSCRSGTIPVYAFFNNRRDANHRYTIDMSVRRAMNNRAWVPDGETGVAFCSLI